MVKKFAKYRKVCPTGCATRGGDVEFGVVGLKALECGRLTQKQVEAARIVIVRACGRKGRFFTRKNIFFPITKKPLEVRMGGGKGPIELHAAAIRQGAILFELDNIPLETAVAALNKASYKLNIKCKIVFRRFIKLNA